MSQPRIQPDELPQAGRPRVTPAFSAIVTTCADGQVLAWPGPAAKSFGWPAAQALGRSLFELIVPGEVLAGGGDAFARLLADARASAGNLSLETTVQRRDGSRFPAELIVLPGTLGGGPSLSVCIRDISRRVQVQEELQSAKEAAEQASEAKGQFLARMSHEIRTPLNGVLGMLELLLATRLSASQQRYGEAMHRSALSLLQIINDVLDFSKIEAGKLELVPEPFDLQELLDDVNELFAEQARAKDLELLNVREESAPRNLVGDALRLRQVLVNLVGNAMKFTERGEIVTKVAATHRGRGQVCLHFDVRDTGMGIAPALLGRVFSSFSQADGSATRRYGGTGLGLAIARQLVELMGGEIGVQSEPGKGSTFSFSVKLALREPEALATMRTPALLDCRVLVVDDNPPSRRILAHKLNHWGLQATPAENARDALSRLRDGVATGQAFDVAILDRMMPGMDGLALAREIRADQALAQTRLIMLSATREDDQRTWRDAGIDLYLTKPARLSEIHSCLMKLMSARKGTLQMPAVRAEPFAARVLVVEDNEINQQVARGMLKLLGCDVKLAANGRIALETLLQSEYDLILMDCHMPELDGYETTRALRRRETEKTLHHTPVIALTANAMDGDREKCLAAGMDDFLAKPFSVEQLTQTLETWLT